MNSTCPECRAKGVSLVDKLRWGASRPIMCQSCGARLRIHRAVAFTFIVLSLSGAVATVPLALALATKMPSGLAGVVALATILALILAIWLCAFMVSPLQRHYDEESPK